MKICMLFTGEAKSHERLSHFFPPPQKARAAIR